VYSTRRRSVLFKTLQVVRLFFDKQRKRAGLCGPTAIGVNRRPAPKRTDMQGSLFPIMSVAGTGRPRVDRARWIIRPL